MTLTEASERIDAIDKGMGKRCEADGRDLRIERSAAWSWGEMQRVAAALGTEQIDLAGRDPYDTLPGLETIAGRYEHEYGCGTCGYGSVLIVRGILDEAT